MSANNNNETLFIVTETGNREVNTTSNDIIRIHMKRKGNIKRAKST